MAYTKTLYDGDGNAIYPVTKANAVYMKGSKVTVETVLDDMMEASKKVEFLEDGDIKVTHKSGNISTTEFLQDGNMKEVTTDSKGNVIYTKTTTFEADGSIVTDVIYEGEEEE